MKKKKLFKLIISIILMVLQIVAIGFFGYSIILYNGVETFYRIYAIVILAYLFLLLSYLLLKNVSKKKILTFVITSVVVLLIASVEFFGYYYLTKIYKAIDAYSENKNLYHTSLVSYNKKYSTFNDLSGKKVGIVKDKEDIEGNILPNMVIKDIKLEDKNTIKEYDSTMELLYALKENEVDAAFFSSNYVEMFSSMEGFENIETETVVLYTADKEYIASEEDIKNETSSLNKPFTMLFIGVDSSKDGVTSGYNADVLLLATFNPDTLRATLTSIPRDTYIRTACSGSSYRRINTTTWGSASTCAVNTVEDLFDVDIDYYAKINFKGIVELVDAVGGIDVNVPYSFCEQNSSRKWGKNTVYVKKGKQHLNGEQALALARNRHGWPNKCSSEWNQGTRNDFVRGKNQIKVIMGIVNAATKLRDPNQAVDILKSIEDNFQTNIKTKDILQLYNLGKSLVISDSTNLVNVQRMQLKTYSAWGKIYDRGYPAVELPYQGSINDIKKQININLGKSKPTLIKKISFDLNDPYQDSVVGQGNYSKSTLNTLKDVSSYSFDKLRSYASSNNLTLKFIDVDTNKQISLNDYSEYRFYSQKEHKDTLISTISTLTIKVKKRTYNEPIITPEVTPSI